MLCVAEGAPELRLRGGPSRQSSSRTRKGATARALREAVELVQDTRLRLALNVSEELALEALRYRVELAIGPRLGSSP